MNSFDPITLQRLIDGELDEKTTRQMLSMSENHPHLWREMALGFVEDQIWNREIKSSLVDSAEPLKNVTLKRSTNESTSSLMWLASAAGLLLALTVGFLSGQSFNGGSLSGTLADNPLEKIADQQSGPADQLADQTSNVIPSDGATLVNYQPDFHLEFEDPHGNPVLNSQVPMYSFKTAREMGSDFWSQQSRQSQLREQFADSGYFLDESTHYISGQSGDGRQIVIPVRTTNFSAGQ